MLEDKHVACVDDHLTVIRLALPEASVEEASQESIPALIRGVVLGVRDALDTAIRSADFKRPVSGVGLAVGLPVLEGCLGRQIELE